jgi:uncharacterized membrane protein
LNGAQLHLLINHFPVLIPLLGAPVLALGLLRRSETLRDVGGAFLVFGALAAIPVYLTGQPAESVIKNYPGTSRMLIHDHEGVALFALIWAELSGAAALALLLFARLGKPLARRSWPWVAVILLSLVTFIVMARTAHLGGLIRHEEIRGTDTRF